MSATNPAYVMEFADISLTDLAKGADAETAALARVYVRLLVQPAFLPTPRLRPLRRRRLADNPTGAVDDRTAEMMAAPSQGTSRG